MIAQLMESLGLVLDFRCSRNRDQSAGSFPERLEIESKSSERKNVLSMREFFCAPGPQFEKNGRNVLVQVNKKGYELIRFLNQVDFPGKK